MACSYHHWSSSRPHAPRTWDLFCRIGHIPCTAPTWPFLGHRHRHCRCIRDVSDNHLPTNSIPTMPLPHTAVGSRVYPTRLGPLSNNQGMQLKSMHSQLDVLRNNKNWTRVKSSQSYRQQGRGMARGGQGRHHSWCTCTSCINMWALTRESYRSSSSTRFNARHRMLLVLEPCLVK